MSAIASSSSSPSKLEDYFNNLQHELSVLERDITPKNLKEALNSFKTLYNRFELKNNTSHDDLCHLLDCFERILFCLPVEKMSQEMYTAIERPGHDHLRSLIGKLQALPHRERAQRKVKYLLWIAQTHQEDHQPEHIILPYYAHILILSEGKFDTECRNSFFNWYENFLKKVQPSFKNKLIEALKLDQQDSNQTHLEAVLKVLEAFEREGISTEVLIPYLKDAIAVIIPHAKNAKELLLICDTLEKRIAVLRKNSSFPKGITPLERHHRSLHDYREKFKTLFQKYYNACFNNHERPPSSIFEEVATLQNTLFENFTTFYKNTLENSLFSFALRMPPLHSLHLTGSMGRKEPSLYSDLELFILIEEEGFFNPFLDHLNLELKTLNAKKKGPFSSLQKEKPLFIKAPEFYLLECKLSGEEIKDLKALNKHFQKEAKETELALTSKELVQKRFIELLKEKIHAYLDGLADDSSSSFQKDLKRTLDLCRHFFKIPQEESPDGLINVLANKGLFSPKTAELLKTTFSRNPLEGPNTAYFKESLYLLDLTCSAFGEKPPHQQLGIEEKDLLRKGLFLDVPEEGRLFACSSSQAFALLQTRKGCYHNLQAPPFEYSLLQSRPLHLSPLTEEYQNTLQTILTKKKLPPEEAVEGMTNLRQKIALSLLSFRVKKALPKKQKELPPLTEIINLKTDLIQTLYYPLHDLALYFGIEETHTLTLIDRFIEEKIFTEESGDLLKNTLAALYMIRTQCQIQKGGDIAYFIQDSKMPPLEAYCLTQIEQDKLKQAYFLVMKPLYQKLQDTLSIHQVNLKNRKNKQPDPFESFKQIDLFKEGLEPIRRELSKSEDGNQKGGNVYGRSHVQALCSYLLQTGAPKETHLYIYEQLLSKCTFFEPLRKTYLELLTTSPYYEELRTIPNIDGFRYSTLDKQCKLHEGLLAMTTEEAAQKPLIRVFAPHFADKPRYLKQTIAQEIMEGKNLQNHYKRFNPRHNVAKASLDSYSIHFKQMPGHPMMDYAVHALNERIFGEGTPSVELLRFEIEGEDLPIPVLASTTLGDYSLGQAIEKDIHLYHPSFTKQLLLDLLTKPGDGRASNRVVGKDGFISSIDNEVSFVEPTIRTMFGFRKTQFSSVLFCLEDTLLHADTLEKFCQCQPDHILHEWVKELESKEEEFLALFPEEDMRKRLYKHDPENPFHVELLLREGTLIALYLQWFHLRNALATYLSAAIPAENESKSLDNKELANENSRKDDSEVVELKKDKPSVGISDLGEEKKFSPQDLLKELITIRPENLCDKNLIGERVYKAYISQKKLPPLKRLEAITEEKESLPTKQAHQASLGKTPQFHDIQKRKQFSIEEAKKEIFAIHLKAWTNEISLTQDGEAVHVNLRGVSTERAALILKSMTALLAYQEPPKHVTIVGTRALAGKTLAPFLRESLTYLNLSECSSLNASDLQAIAKCPNLKYLYLSKCTGIKKFADIESKKDTPIKFPMLKKLDLEACNLQALQIEAPNLKVIKAAENPSLETVTLHIPFTSVVTLEKEYALPKGVSFFDQKDWETYFGEVESAVYPDFLTLIDILSRRRCCLILMPNRVNGEPFHLNTLKKVLDTQKAGYKLEFKSDINYDDISGTHYDSISEENYNDILEEFGTEGKGPQWVLISRVSQDFHYPSYCKAYTSINFSIDSSKRSNWQYATVLQVATAILTYVKSGEEVYLNRAAYFGLQRPEEPVATLRPNELGAPHLGAVLFIAFRHTGCISKIIEDDAGYYQYREISLRLIN